MKRKLHVLLTNDDGYSAPGIHHIYTALKKEFLVTVVAPETEQSGIGHAFTYHKPLDLREKRFEDTTGYVVSGTPADCVKIALGHILSKKPDVIVSGLNDGNNAGIAGYYSGTVAAAREGAFWQIPGIAFSLCESPLENASEYATVAATILKRIITEEKSPDSRYTVYYNVNFPSCSLAECAGIKVTRQSLSFWDDRYTPVQKENGDTAYQLHGERKDIEIEDEYDARAIASKFITITPLHIDATASEWSQSLMNIENIL